MNKMKFMSSLNSHSIWGNAVKTECDQWKNKNIHKHKVITKTDKTQVKAKRRIRKGFLEKEAMLGFRG